MTRNLHSVNNMLSQVSKNLSLSILRHLLCYDQLAKLPEWRMKSQSVVHTVSSTGCDMSDPKPAVDWQPHFGFIDRLGRYQYSIQSHQTAPMDFCYFSPNPRHLFWTSNGFCHGSNRETLIN